MRLAIVGSGISGLAVAHRLHGRADITLFESGDYFGGHTHTVDLTLAGASGPVCHGVDTGFLVFNERTYPELIRLFGELGVPTARSDMSFSVQVPGHGAATPLEWSGSSLNTVFAQRRNLVRPRFLAMLRDVLRFNRLATDLAVSGGFIDGLDGVKQKRNVFLLGKCHQTIYIAAINNRMNGEYQGGVVIDTRPRSLSAHRKR